MVQDHIVLMVQYGPGPQVEAKLSKKAFWHNYEQSAFKSNKSHFSANIEVKVYVRQ